MVTSAVAASEDIDAADVAVSWSPSTEARESRAPPFSPSRGFVAIVAIATDAPPTTRLTAGPASKTPAGGAAAPAAPAAPAAGVDVEAGSGRAAPGRAWEGADATRAPTGLRTGRT